MSYAPWLYRGTVLVLLGTATVASASVVRTVTQEQARAGQVRIEVASGYGVNISFQKLQERIIRVWVDDVSELLVEFDRPPPDTQVIHMRRLQKAELPLQTRSVTGETLMTVVTDQGLYQFFIQPVDRRAAHKTIEIIPSPVTRIPVGTSEFATVAQIEKGIEEAIFQQRLAADSPLVNRLRQFLTLLRQGIPPEQASRQAGVSLNTIADIARLGKRPTPLLERIRRREENGN